jgi:uncharacterized NAD(P)/FAD-binding protein YdhS
MTKYDLTFIGGGMSCVTVLTAFIGDFISKRDVRPSPIRIAVVEYHKQLWTGLPYGDRSWVNCLTISTLGEFLTDPKHLKEFIAWFELNQSLLIEEYKILGGDAAEKWCSVNLDAIEGHRLQDIPIPRYWFGQFKAQKLTNLIQQATDQGVIVLTTYQAAAQAIDKGKEFEVHLMDDSGEKKSIFSDKVILSNGHLPSKKDSILSECSSSRVLQNLYEPNVQSNLDTIHQKLSGMHSKQKANILLVGTNATSVELLNLIYNQKSLRDLVSKITVISHSGQFPKASVRRLSAIEFSVLNQFSENEKNDPTIIAKAMIEEFSAQFNTEVCANILGGVLQKVRRLLSDLTDEEYSHFLQRYGDDITRSTRRVAENNLTALNYFLRNNMINVLCGRVRSVTENFEGGSLYLTYDNEESQEKVFEDSFQMVVSCIGYETINDCSCLFVNDALRKGLCKINQAGKGLEVGSTFEASPGLYVYGPLLAGNVNDTIHYWHFENISRLLDLGPLLSDCLVSSLGDGHPEFINTSIYPITA